VVAAVPGGDGREPKANHPAEPGALRRCQGTLTRVKRRADASKRLPKISTALAKPAAAAPISWLTFMVLDEGLGSTSYVLSVVPWMGSLATSSEPSASPRDSQPCCPYEPRPQG